MTDFLLGCLAALSWRIAGRRHPCSHGHDWSEPETSPGTSVWVKTCARCPAWQAYDELGSLRADVVRWTHLPDPWRTP